MSAASYILLSFFAVIGVFFFLSQHMDYPPQMGGEEPAFSNFSVANLILRNTPSLLHVLARRDDLNSLSISTVSSSFIPTTLAPSTSSIPTVTSSSTSLSSLSSLSTSLTSSSLSHSLSSSSSLSTSSSLSSTTTSSTFSSSSLSALPSATSSTVSSTVVTSSSGTTTPTTTTSSASEVVTTTFSTVESGRTIIVTQTSIVTSSVPSSSQTSDAPSSGLSSSNKIVVGVCVGVGGALLIVFAGAIFWFKKNKDQGQQSGWTFWRKNEKNDNDLFDGELGVRDRNINQGLNF